MMEEGNSSDKTIHKQKKDYFNHPFSIDSLLQICSPIQSSEIPSNKNLSNQKDSLNKCKEFLTNGGKKKRHRSTFTSTQIRVLEYEFMNSRYISTEHRSRLANFLGISEQQIKIWFQNRRYKTRLTFLNKNDTQNCVANLNIKEQDNFTIDNILANNFLITKSKNSNLNIQSLFHYNTCTNIKNCVL